MISFFFFKIPTQKQSLGSLNKVPGTSLQPSQTSIRILVDLVLVLILTAINNFFLIFGGVVYKIMCKLNVESLCIPKNLNTS